MGLVKEVIKEIGNKSREFYEFVLPPIDMYLIHDNLKVVIDIPGFSKKISNSHYVVTFYQSKHAKSR